METDPKELMMKAEGAVTSASKMIGEARGCCGGWGNETRYQDAHRLLYEARIANGIEVTRRKRNGSYYILGS